MHALLMVAAGSPYQSSRSLYPICRRLQRGDRRQFSTAESLAHEGYFGFGSTFFATSDNQSDHLASKFTLKPASSDPRVNDSKPLGIQGFPAPVVHLSPPAAHPSREIRRIGFNRQSMGTRSMLKGLDTEYEGWKCNIRRHCTGGRV